MILSCQNNKKQFGETTIINRCSFYIEDYEKAALVGINGAGKTTAMRMLCGLSIPTAGTASVAGYDVGRQAELVKRHIGYMSQKFSLYSELTVKENIALFAGIYGLSRREIKDRSQSLAKSLDLGEEMNMRVGILPMGQQQKLAFSVATIHNPEVVFLDEPTGGVDPVTRRRFWELIYQASAAGTTVFVTTHYMDEAEYCNRVSVMVDGQIKALGSPAELKQTFNAASMDEVFRALARNATRNE